MLSYFTTCDLSMQWGCVGFSVPLLVIYWWIRPLWVVNHIHLGCWHLINKDQNCCHDPETSIQFGFPVPTSAGPPADLQDKHPVTCGLSQHPTSRWKQKSYALFFARQIIKCLLQCMAIGFNQACVNTSGTTERITNVDMKDWPLLHM